ANPCRDHFGGDRRNQQAVEEVYEAIELVALEAEQGVQRLPAADRRKPAIVGHIRVLMVGADLVQHAEREQQATSEIRQRQSPIRGDQPDQGGDDERVLEQMDSRTNTASRAPRRVSANRES